MCGKELRSSQKRYQQVHPLVFTQGTSHKSTKHISDIERKQTDNTGTKCVLDHTSEQILNPVDGSVAADIKTNQDKLIETAPRNSSPLFAFDTKKSPDMAYKNSPAEKHYDGTRPTLTSTTSLPTNCVSRPSNTEQTNQVVDTVAAPEIPQQTHSAFHMSDCISQEEKKETSSVNTQTKVKDTKVSSTPANQSVAVSDKTVTNTQQGYKIGTGKSSECLNIINFDKTSDTVDKDKITKMDHYDITPFLRSNMTIGADSNSSSKQENMQHFTPNFTLTGARPKSSINSSNTFPKEVAAGDTTSKTHSEKKIDSAVPADGTMVLTGARPKFSINSSNTFPKEVAAGDTTSKTHSEKKTDFTVPADMAMVLTGARPKSSINSLNTFPKEVVAGDTTSKPHSEKKTDFAVPADGAMVPTGAKPKFSINSSNTFPKEVTASDTTSITHSEKKIDFAAPADETMVLMGARPKSSINSSNTFPKEVAAGDTTSKTHSEKKIDSAVPADGTMVLTGARPKFSINSSNTFPKEVAAGDTTSKTHSEKKTDFTVPADMAMVLTGARPKSSINSSNTFPKEVVAGDTTCKTHSEKKTDFVVPADGAMVLTGARAKSSINSSNTFPKEVAAGDTTCKTHSERNDRKKIDFALPVNGAMVLPAGNFAETRLTSNADKNENPMALAIPTKEQLLNAFGGALGYFKSSSLERGCDDAYHIGNIFLMKNKVLGQGPSSIVFEGRLESVDGMPVAVKRITCKNEYMAAKTRKEMDEIWKKLFREVEVLRGIEQWRHPNIVGYYQSQTALNELYIAFQLCQGDLEDYVNEEFGFWRENISALEINQNMAEGVRFLHTNSIVHRDLKPKNVFLVWQQGRCRAVIGDFGMSKVTDRGVYSLSLSVGSIGYLAPEVWEEASKAVRRNNRERPKIQDKSDIFSLGLLFFFTNTNGNHPFGDELLGGQLQIAAGRQPHFDHTRPEDFTLEVLLRKMFTRNPGSRPTADEVCEQPALWDYDAILKFFCDCSEKVEAMVRDGKSIDKIVPNNILPHGNWMRDLPDNLRQYLKQHRVHGKLLYQGRESSTRYLLRAIRNTAAHNPKLPKEVVDDFGTHPAVFWNKKCPRLLTHLFNNIDCEWNISVW